MESKREKVANILQSARVQKGLSVEDIAKKAGCKPNTLLKIEKGVFSPGAEVLYAIADAIGITIKINDTKI